MNDDLNNRSSKSITTLFPRLRVLLLLCAYCIPFSFFIFTYWGDLKHICLTVLWLILLIFLTQKAKDMRLIVWGHGMSWMMSFICDQLLSAHMVSPLHPNMIDHRIQICLISIALCLIHYIIAIVINKVPLKTVFAKMWDAICAVLFN